MNIHRKIRQKIVQILDDRNPIGLCHRVTNSYLLSNSHFTATIEASHSGKADSWSDEGYVVYDTRRCGRIVKLKIKSDRQWVGF
jgi:hypothetical protein